MAGREEGWGRVPVMPLHHPPVCGVREAAGREERNGKRVTKSGEEHASYLSPLPF